MKRKNLFKILAGALERHRAAAAGNKMVLTGTKAQRRAYMQLLGSLKIVKGKDNQPVQADVSRKKHDLATKGLSFRDAVDVRRMLGGDFVEFVLHENPELTNQCNVDQATPPLANSTSKSWLFKQPTPQFWLSSKNDSKIPKAQPMPAMLIRGEFAKAMERIEKLEREAQKSKDANDALKDANDALSALPREDEVVAIEAMPAAETINIEPDQHEAYLDTDNANTITLGSQPLPPAT